jgi:hypothetical protein
LGAIAGIGEYDNLTTNMEEQMLLHEF